MSIVVRRILANEAAVLKDTRLNALADRPEAFGSNFEHEVSFADDVWAERAREASAGDRAVTFLAWREDLPVGIVAGFRSGDTVDLVSMWASPDVRRQGVGRALTAAVVAWADRVGAERVELWVMRGNDNAQRLYESAGFVLAVDHRPRASDPCKNEIRMVHLLDRPRPFPPPN